MFTLSTILVTGVLAGCSLFAPPTSDMSLPSLYISSGGWLLATPHQVWVNSPTGDTGQAYPFQATVKGILIQPTSRNSLVFLEDNGTWTIWSIGQADSHVVYSTKAPLSACSVAPNGHALACLQAGDVYLIQLADGSVERIDQAVVALTWSPTNSDLLVQYADRTELIGLDLTDHVASRTVLLNETGDHPQFMNSQQVIWWQSLETERQLVSFSLRTKEKSVVWSGAAGAGSWLSPKGNRIIFSHQDSCQSNCLTQIVSVPQGQALQSIPHTQAVGWLQQDAVVKNAVTPIDQGGEQTYHFVTLNTGAETDLGSGLFLATDNHLNLEFTQ